MNVVIAVHSYYLFGNVGEAVYVLAIGRYVQRHIVAVNLHAEVKARKYVAHVLRGHCYAQERIDFRDAHRHSLCAVVRIGRLYVAVHVGHGAATQLLNEVKRPVHRHLGGVFVYALFEHGRGIGVLAERARSLSHAVAGELCRLKQQFIGGILNLAVEASHNACKRRGLVAVAYYKVFMVELEGLFVEGDNLFAFFSAADDYLPALEGGEVERVHRLAHFKEHKVCYVDNIIYRAQSAQRQPPSHPHG